jgi:hypothetical protein
MALPTVGRLERMFRPYAAPGDTPVRVWGIDVGWAVPGLPAEWTVTESGPPRLLCLAGGEAALVVVHQRRDHRDELDGFVVPWSLVARLERRSHLVRDELSIEVSGRAPLLALVSNHLFLRGNRAAARALCELSRCAPRPAAEAPRTPASSPEAPERNTRPIPI